MPLSRPGDPPMPLSLVILGPLAVAMIAALMLLSERDTIRAYKGCLRAGNTSAACDQLVYGPKTR